MAKRSHPPAEEVYSLSDVNRPATNANIHGAVVAISPVKKGKYSKCPFFDGDFANETSKIRLVGFDSLQQRRLSDYYERQVPVEIKNCEIKKSRYGDGYDVILRSRSIIKMSERQDIDANQSYPITICHLKTKHQMLCWRRFKNLKIERRLMSG